MNRGFTLVELLIAMVVMAALGTTLARILMSNSRFVGRQDALMEARGTARAAVHAMISELHMVGDGGLLAASRDSVKVRVPYAFGMTCARVGSTLIGSLVPTDSLTVATAVPGGVAWRDDLTGAYTVRTGVTVAASADSAACKADSVRVLSGGKLIGISGLAPGPPAPGRLFYLYQTVTYRFATSVDVPGRKGLWRKDGAGVNEELAAPFDTSARFAFLIGTQMTVQTAPPADLNTVRGLELRLVGASVATPRGRSTPQTFQLRTPVAFMNKIQ